MKSIALASFVLVLLPRSALAQSVAQPRESTRASVADREPAVRASGGGTLASTRGRELAGVTAAAGVGQTWTHLRVLADASATFGENGPTDVMFMRIGPSIEGYTDRLFGGGGVRVDWMRATQQGKKAFDAVGGGLVAYAGVDVVRLGERSAIYVMTAVNLDALIELRASSFEFRMYGARAKPEEVAFVGATVFAGYRFR